MAAGMSRGAFYEQFRLNLSKGESSVCLLVRRPVGHPLALLPTGAQVCHWDQAVLPLSDPTPCPSLEFTGQEGRMCFYSWSLDFLTSVVPGDSFPGVLL